ncbi:hypothetical protein WDU94_007851 [Cyamophila willieti]
MLTKLFYFNQDPQLETTSDEIDLTATHIEDLQDITRDRDRNEEIIRQNDEAIAKIKQTIEKNKSSKRRKTDVIDEKLEMEIVKHIKENLTIRNTEVPGRIQDIDLLTVNNYDSTSGEDVTMPDKSDQNVSIENDNANIETDKITTRKPINQHQNGKDNTKNIMIKLEEPKHKTNGTENTKHILKSNEPKPKDETTHAENIYADNTVNQDETPEIVDEIVGGTSTFLSLTSKTIVHKIGDVVNILSNSFMKVKQMQTEENMESELHVIDANNINKVTIGNAVDAKNKATFDNICKEMEGIHSDQTCKQDKKNGNDTTKGRQVKKSEQCDEKGKRRRNTTDDASEAMNDEMTVESVQKEQSQTTKNVNENKTKIHEGKGLKKLHPVPKSKESSDSNNGEEKTMSKVEEELQSRRNLRGRRKKPTGRRRKVVEESSDTEGDEPKPTNSKKASKVQASISKTSNQTEKRKDEEEQSEDEEEPIKKRGRPKKQASSKTTRSGR